MKKDIQRIIDPHEKNAIDKNLVGWGLEPS
jgi:hypothetical protein